MVQVVTGILQQIIDRVNWQLVNAEPPIQITQRAIQPTQVEQSYVDFLLPGLIGMSVDVPSNLVPWDGDTPAPMTVELDAPAATLLVTVRDENGEAVQTFTLEGVEAGRHELVWDGLDAEGNPLPEGVYTFEVQAFDEAESPVGATPLMNGTVDRVSFGPDGVQVWVNGQAVPYSQIRSIGTSAETTTG